MMKFQKPLLIIGFLGIFAVITVVAFAKSLWQSALYSGGSPRSIVAEDGLIDESTGLIVHPTDPIRGNEAAPIDVIEYGDFQCPYCAQVQPVLDRILASYAKSVRLVWKDFPNPLHAQARSAALAARCAQEQEKFWEYHDYLFANQDQLDRSAYSQIAQKLGLNLARFDACVDAATPIDRIGQHIDEAQRMEVDGTPYFFIRGQRLPYAGTYQEFESLIELALREKASL